MQGSTTKAEKPVEEEVVETPEEVEEVVVEEEEQPVQLPLPLDKGKSAVPYPKQKAILSPERYEKYVRKAGVPL